MSLFLDIAAKNLFIMFNFSQKRIKTLTNFCQVLIRHLCKTLADRSIPLADNLDNEKIQIIRKKYQQLVFKWNTLVAGELLELEFNPLQGTHFPNELE